MKIICVLCGLMYFWRRVFLNYAAGSDLSGFSSSRLFHRLHAHEAAAGVGASDVSRTIDRNTSSNAAAQQGQYHN
jgi:hypothetical protein